MMSNQNPVIIQGGMGAGVSAWQLARAVSLAGQLGVVSGTALDVLLARRLETGDPGGHMRRALDQFPFPDVTQRILRRFFIPGGKPSDQPFRGGHVISVRPSRAQLELVVAANFVEVYLAKEGHDGIVGINFLEKIQPPTLPSLYGAMLGGVDYVLMGAGIPRRIPGVLDQLAYGEAVELPLNVAHSDDGDSFVTRFDPVEFAGAPFPWLRRPQFLAIVASATLASMMVRKASGRVDGLVIEGPTAGGHNAPPRGEAQLNDRGEPVYGRRDTVDLEAIRSLGLPFWLAGSYGSPEQVALALAAGAAGVQVGTAFAFCQESGLQDDLKRRVLAMSREGSLDVLTDPAASPTGFPFKVLNLDETLSEPSAYAERERRCDMGFLRQAYRRPDGKLGWRCPAEPVEDYLRKGGQESETVGRKCLCNALLANIGLGQSQRDGTAELPLVTCGDDVQSIERVRRYAAAANYSAKQVVDYLLSLTAGQKPSEAALAAAY
jgi:nitronate monooxygenase